MITMAIPITKMISLCKYRPSRFIRHFATSRRCFQSAEPLSVPAAESEPTILSPKIENLVEEITKLTMIEVTELSGALKKRLNLPDAPAMAFGAFPGGALKEAEEADETPNVVKSSYTVKLMKFDDKKKVALIKEIKGLLEDMNLVQAKKFVESVPITVKSDISKEEADKLKEALEKVGGEVTVD